jgi:hypothetical protein
MPWYFWIALAIALFLFLVWLEVVHDVRILSGILDALAELAFWEWTLED